MTTKLNLKINQGETYRHAITWKMLDTELPINITGYTARMQIREKITSITPLIELTTENGGLAITDAAAGELLIYMPAGTTSSFAWAGGVYDLEVIAPNTDVTRILEGTVSVKKEVTR